ncbi:hypothetical protein Tco_0385829 [Tanacetum coccineum]
MSDWKPQCHKRKRHFKWLLILSKTPRASRLSLSMQMSRKSFMQQFWYFIKEVQGTDSYESVNFIDVPNDDTTLAFLIKIGYKGPLYNQTNMFVDHMHQPWRTLEAIIIKCPLAAIINKCLSGKIASNDKLRKSKIDILWGMFYKENVDYPELIWEILHTRLITGRRIDQGAKTCHSPDSPRLKFVRIGEDYQEYGLHIPETMLTEAIKQSEFYQMFIKYSTGQIRPKKSIGKGSQRRKTADDSQETVDVSEESNPEPEPAKRKTASRRVVKKKLIISAADNVIPDPDVALELGKSISITEVEEEEAAKQVHATHARIVTEFVPKSAKKKTSRSSKSKLKGVPSLTPEEQEVVDIMQALIESKKTSKRQPGTRGSSEGTGTKPGVPDESTVISATSSEGTGTKPGFPMRKRKYLKKMLFLSGDQNKKYKIRMCKDDDEKMINAEVDDSDKGDEEITDAAKADVEKTSGVKDDAKKIELPPTSSSLFVSSCFGDQFLKLSSDSSLVSTVKDTTNAEINSLLEVKIQSEVPPTQSSSMLSVPVFVISEPTVLTSVQESLLKVIITTLPPPSVSTTPSIPQQTTTPIPTPTITTEAPIITTSKIDLSAEALVALKTQVPSVIDNYLGSKVGDVFQKELKKHIADLIQKYSLQQIPKSSKKQTPTVDLEQGSEKSASEILKIKKEQAEKQQTPKFTIKSTDQATLNEYDHKSALYQTMHANKSFNRNLGVADTVQDHKRKHDDDEDDDDGDPLARPNQCKASSKGSKTGKSATAKEPVDEPIAEVIMDDAGDNVVHDDDQP